MEQWGTYPLEFLKFCAFCSFCQLNCKHFENHQRKTCVTFSSISTETQKNSGKQIKTASEPEKIPGRGGEEKFMFGPLTSFPGDVTGTNHGKRTGVHCRRAGEWDHQITVSRRPRSVRHPAQEEKGWQSSRR